MMEICEWCWARKMFCMYKVVQNLCVNKSQFVPVIFEPPCMSSYHTRDSINHKYVFTYRGLQTSMIVFLIAKRFDPLTPVAV